jgi:hypothetical protein
MNELQIKLTADIKDIQSALTKVKKTLKEFEDSASSSTDKANGKFDRQKGIIEELNNELKKLKVSIIQATSKEQIAGFNAELEKTNQKLVELNALGKTVTAPAVRSFDNLKRAQGAASSAAISFGRIIQDAPFGIIGVANNIQNFGEQFVALGGKSATASQKLSQFFSALITPSNLAILAVSALTAAWQAYELGIFGAKEATKTLSDQINELSERNKSATANASAELTKLESLKQIIEDETISRDKRLKAVNRLIELYPELFSLGDKEKLLNGQLIKSYELLTKAIIAKAEASIAQQELPRLIKEKESVDQLLKAKQNLLKTEEERLKIASTPQAFSGELGQTQLNINNVSAAYNGVEKRVESLKSEIKDLELLQKGLAIPIEGYKESIKSFASEFENVIDPLKETKAGGEKINRVIDEQILLTQRFGKEVDKNKKKIESLGESLAVSLEQEQSDLLQTIAKLKKEPADLINTEKLEIAEKRLSEIDNLIGSLASKRANIEIKIDESKLEGLELPGKQEPGIIEKLEKEIALYEKLAKVTSDPDQLAKYQLKLSQLRQELDLVNGEKVKSNLEIVGDAFSSLASGIVASLDISNRSLRGFLTTLISATPKIIAAISAQSNAKSGAAAKNIAADKAESISSGIKQGTKFAEALGPVGLALLPVFIAGAVAVISSAFSKTSGGGGSVSGGSGSTFTNRREFGGPVSKGRAYIVGEKRPELFVPNTNGIIVPQVPSMDYSGASVSSGMYGVEVMLKGPDDLLFFVEQAQIRRNIR